MKGSQYGGNRCLWQETATVLKQKIIQKKSSSHRAWEFCLFTHVCVPYQLVKPHHSCLLKWHLNKFCLFLFFTQGNSGWHSTTVNPERHPWQHHHKCCGKVCLQQEEEDVPSQCEVDVETIVPACKHSKKPDRFRFSFTTMKKITFQHIQYVKPFLVVKHTVIVAVMKMDF